VPGRIYAPRAVAVISTEATCQERFLRSIPATTAGCPISARFWQMWDSAGLPSSQLRDPLFSPSSNSSNLGHPSSLVIPTAADPDFLFRAASDGTCAALLRDSRMALINATGLDSKSGGGAQWRDLRCALAAPFRCITLQ
jgi:hypothetical protein